MVELGDLGDLVKGVAGIHYPFVDLNNTNTQANTLAQAEAFGAWIEPKMLQQATSQIG